MILALNWTSGYFSASGKVKATMCTQNPGNSGLLGGHLKKIIGALFVYKQSIRTLTAPLSGVTCAAGLEPK